MGKTLFGDKGGLQTLDIAGNLSNAIFNSDHTLLSDAGSTLSGAIENVVGGFTGANAAKKAADDSKSAATLAAQQSQQALLNQQQQAQAADVAASSGAQGIRNTGNAASSLASNRASLSSTAGSNLQRDFLGL